MLNFSLMNKTNFFQKVYEVVRVIPEGRVTSYGAIARFLGSGKAARMVGWAMNASFKDDPYLPAHRVVNRNGLLTGRAHFNPPELMQQLLENEGIKVTDNQIQDFEKILWDPNIELN